VRGPGDGLAEAILLKCKLGCQPELEGEMAMLYGLPPVADARETHARMESVTAVMSGPTISGVGPSGNRGIPFLATNAACQPAFIAP